MKTKSFMTLKIDNEHQYQHALLSAKELLRNGFTYSIHRDTMIFTREDNDGTHIRNFTGPRWQVKCLQRELEKRRSKIAALHFVESVIFGYRNKVASTEQLTWKLIERYLELRSEAYAI